MYCFKHHGFCAVVRRPKNPKHKTQLVVPEAIRRRRSFNLLRQKTPDLRYLRLTIDYC